MPLKIYNSLTKSKEEFIPREEGKVGMYVCGVTVYDRAHVGHARAAVVFDVIFRFLRYLGYRVTYVRNYTDVDDKIINRANQEGVPSQVIAERYIQEYEQDMKAMRKDMNRQFSQIMLLIQQNPSLAHIKPEILSKKMEEY